MQLAPIGRSGHPGSRVLVSDGPSLLDRIGKRFQAASGNEELATAIEWAECEIRSITHAEMREPETLAERDARILVEYESKPARFAADRECLSAMRIRQIREAGGRDPRTGRKPGAPAPRRKK